MADEYGTDPAQLHANAWCGEEVHGALGPDAGRWGARRDLPQAAQMLAPKPLDLAKWSDPRVGWGLIVPDNDRPPEEKARGEDLSPPLRELVSRRNDAPIFRYRADLAEGRLGRYAAGGSYSEPSLRGKRGVEADAVPHYLLIAASPAEIPWSFQYRLQTDAFVGRLDLDEAGLGRYVEALLGGWDNCSKRRTMPLVWAVDHGHPDITRLMRKTIAERLAKALSEDGEFDMALGLRSDAEATHDKLIAALVERDPAFVMTSSHGATFPLGTDPQAAQALRGNLGLPVDQARTTMKLDALSAWNPYGAIWYAHACCSAGADGRSRFAGIVGAASSLGRTLDGVAAAGACQAPLPRALLGGARPARAFIGHVEPTFDWTLRDPVTGQSNTQPLIDAFYGQLHLASSPPIGLALAGYFRAVAGLLQDHLEALDALNAHAPGAKERACRSKLIALDRLAMVILGDPTVGLQRPA
jgi:hypothetical protein